MKKFVILFLLSVCIHAQAVTFDEWTTVTDLGGGYYSLMLSDVASAGWDRYSWDTDRLNISFIHENSTDVNPQLDWSSTSNFPAYLNPAPATATYVELTNNVTAHYNYDTGDSIVTTNDSTSFKWWGSLSSLIMWKSYAKDGTNEWVNGVRADFDETDYIKWGSGVITNGTGTAIVMDRLTGLSSSPTDSSISNWHITALCGVSNESGSVGSYGGTLWQYDNRDGLNNNLELCLNVDSLLTPTGKGSYSLAITPTQVSSLSNGYITSAIRTTENFSITGGVDRTVMFWMDADSITQRGLAAWGVNAATTVWEFQQVSATTVQVWLGAGYRRWNVSNIQNLHHIAIVQSGTNSTDLVCYQDGVVQGINTTVAGEVNTGDSSFVWGASKIGSASFFGLLDNLMVFDIALTSNQVHDAFTYDFGMNNLDGD